ncbi:hypothetical protein WJM97_03400 [Okeanomitos corallinicola TIOX110]|jgi:hypothetical protein|uniref:Uncharacterized protein n=1 Tax=Okeanomitos corallinicola TIOX110 TaxID=3133117 RepID=A0ABZ2UWL7_9CYAN
MNDFNFKFLATSGIAIASALVLFKTVTAYGENHLRATSLIHTRYHLQINQNLPNCQKTNKLILKIQQSGIYINAALLPIKTNAATKTPLNLTGKFKDQKLTLSGNINTGIFCQNSSVQNHQIQPITIQMSQLTQEYIPGQIKINNIPKTLEFTALPQTKKKPISQIQNH